VASGDIIRIGGGTDWSKYNILSQIGSFSPASIDTYATLFSVVGAGYISCALGHYGVYQKNGYIKITIDDVVVFESSATGENRGGTDSIIGLTTSEYVMSSVTTGSTTWFLNNNIMGQFSTFPYIETSVQSKRCCLLSQPIFFKKNFKVEAKTNDITGAYQIAIIGGIEK